MEPLPSITSDTLINSTIPLPLYLQETLSEKVAQLLKAQETRKAIQQCFLSLAEFEQSSNKRDVYEALFLAIPRLNPDEYLTLISLLPPFLKLTSDHLNEQRQLASALAQWHAQQAHGKTLEENYPSYQNAMSYFGLAIQIAKKQENYPLYQESHRLASHLLLTIMEQYLVHHQDFKNRLKRARNRGNDNEVRNLINHIEALSLFCCEEKDRNILFTLYDTALDICGLSCPDAQKQIYETHRALIHDKKEQMKRHPFVLNEGRTLEYYDLLENCRNAFKRFLEKKPKAHTSIGLDLCYSQEMRSFQKQVTEKFKIFFNKLLNNAVAILGQPPCSYDIRAMGSLGREEPCPFSDLEFMILIEDENQEWYFRSLAQFLHLQILSLGETASKELVFPCLGLSNRSGMHLDFPSSFLDIIGTPYKMARKQLVDLTTAQDPNNFVHTALKSISLLNAESSLYETYLAEIDKIMNESRQDGHSERHFRSLELIRTRCKDYDKAWKDSHFEMRLSLKDQYVSFIHYLWADLSLFWRIQATNTIDILKEIPDRILTQRSKELLKEAAATVYHIRLGLHRDSQNEEGSISNTAHALPLNSTAIFLTTAQVEKLKQYYYLILRPLFSHLNVSLQKEKKLDEIFNQLDFIRLTIEEAWKNLNPHSPSMIFQAASYLVKSKASIEEHVDNFKCLLRQSHRPLCDSYLEALADSQFRQLVEQLAWIDFPLQDKAKEIDFIHSCEMLNLSLAEDQKQLLLNLFEKFPMLEKLNLLKCDMDSQQIQEAFSEATHLTELQLTCCSFPCETLLEILNQHQSLYLILGQMTLEKEHYLSLFRFAWQRNQKISICLNEQPICVTQDKLDPLLIQALEKKNEFFADIFIALGANIHQKDQRGRNLLHQLARQEHSSLLFLLHYGLLINEKSGEQGGYTPLHYAAQVGCVHNIKLLLKRGARLEEKNKDHKTPLHLAVIEGRDQAVAYLLKHEAHLLAKTREEWTVFHYAVSYERVSVLHLLIQQAQQPQLSLVDYLNLPDSDGKTPLHLAVWGNPKTAIVKILLENGADAKAKNKWGYTALHWAAKHGHLESAQLLIDKGAESMVINQNGDTPLDLAIRWRQPQLVRFLTNQRNVQQFPQKIDIPQAYATFVNAFYTGHALEQCQYLEKMGQLHLEKGEYITAACLINSALYLAKQYDLQPEMSKEIGNLENLEGEFTHRVLGAKTPSEHRHYIKKYHDLLREARQQIASYLTQGNMNKSLYDKFIVQKFNELIYLMCSRCWEVLEVSRVEAMGKPTQPINSFTLFAMGSWAREEMSSFSEIKFGIIIEKDTPAMRNFVRQFSQLLELKLCNMGETPYSLLFLKKENSQSQPIAISLIPKGFCANRSHFTPIGKSGVFELTGTVEQLTSILKPEWIDQHPGEEGLIEEMTCCKSLFGDEKLILAFEKQSQKILDSEDAPQRLTERKKLARRILINQVTENEESQKKTFTEQRMINPKIDLYRLIQRLIKGLSLYYACQSKNTFARLDELERKKILNAQAAKKIRQALQEAITWRMRCQLYQNKGQETCYYQSGSVSHEKAVLFINDKDFQAIQKIYHVIHPFCEATKAFLQGNEKIFTRAPCYNEKALVTPSSVTWHAFAPTGGAWDALCLQPQAEKLDSFIRDTELEQLFPHYYEQYLIDLQILYTKAMHQYGETPHRDTYEILCRLGTVYAFLNDRENSLKCLIQAHLLLEKLEAMAEPISLGVEARVAELKERAIKANAILYNNLGTVCLIMQKLEAIQHLERSISLCRQLAKEDPSLLATCYFNLACAYEYEQQFNQAIGCFEKILPLLTKSAKSSLDRSIPLCKTRMGMAYYKLGNYKQANTHLMKALEIYKTIHEKNPHPDISFVMEQLAYTNFRNNQARVAEHYFQNAWNTLWKVYNQTAHPTLTSFLYQRGCFWEELEMWDQAANYYEKAIQNHDSIEGQRSSPLTATILHRQGNCFLKLENHHAAIECFERLLKVKSQTLGSRPDISIYSAFVSLGQIYERTEDFGKSLRCFFKAATVCQQLPLDQKGDYLRNILDHVDAVYTTLQKHHHSITSSHLAIEIYKRYYKADFQLLAEMLDLYASAWASKGDMIKSAFYYRQLNELYRAHSAYSQEKTQHIQSQLNLLAKQIVMA